jgi:hypothetical protein
MIQACIGFFHESLAQVIERVWDQLEMNILQCPFTATYYNVLLQPLSGLVVSILDKTIESLFCVLSLNDLSILCPFTQRLVYCNDHWVTSIMYTDTYNYYSIILQELVQKNEAVLTCEIFRPHSAVLRVHGVLQLGRGCEATALWSPLPWTLHRALAGNSEWFLGSRLARWQSFI